MSGAQSGRKAVAVVVCTLLMLVQVAFWLLVFVALYFYTPSLKRVAEESGMNLSQAQMLLIYASDWFVNYVYLGVPLLLAGLTLMTMALVWFCRALVRSENEAMSPSRSA